MCSVYAYGESDGRQMKIDQLPGSKLTVLLILARFQSPATGNLKVRGWKPGAQLTTWRVDSTITPELENSSGVSAHPS